MKQPRDADGQYVALGTLFERERIEHSKDHEQERQVAKETAQRLEREVEQTALRLERVVEETALRIEKAVHTALAAVDQTARVHSDAHSREHVAHERIHGVEKAQVDKAAVDVDTRLQAMNEFRGALQDQSKNMVSRELFDAGMKEQKREIDLRASQTDGRLSTIERKLDLQAGKKEGISDTARVTYAVVAAIGVIVGIAATIIAVTHG